MAKVKPNKRDSSLTESDYEKIGRQLESLMVGHGGVSRSRIFWTNFSIGLIRGFGAVLGATIGIAILIWILTLFTHVPLIGPLVQNVKQTVNSAGN